MMRCAVIDDEPLARECIADYIEKVDFLQLAGVGANPLALTELVDRGEVDLLFLDIHMPVMNGIDYLKISKSLPQVILTTAYPGYALEGYELDVVDYLLKPITFNRFYKAVSKAKDYHSLASKVSSAKDNKDKAHFFVKCNQVFEKIYIEEVLYIEAQENYITIHTTQQKYMVLMPIKRMEELLGSGFLRVHKSYLVAQDKIKAVENHQVLIDDHAIPVSRTYRTAVLEKVVEKNIWRK